MSERKPTIGEMLIQGAREAVASKRGHWGSVVRESDPRIVIDTARAPSEWWATLIISPGGMPWQEMRPVLSPDLARAADAHVRVGRWALDLYEAVSCDPEVCGGRPVIRGTRVFVDQVMHFVRNGQLVDWDILQRDYYPGVAREKAEALARLPGHVQRTLVAMCDPDWIPRRERRRSAASNPLWDPDHPHDSYDPDREGPLEYVHRTRPRFEPEEARHDCPAGPLQKGLHGPAITAIVRAGGTWWAHNDEYGSEVRYCPWCGQRLIGPEQKL